MSTSEVADDELEAGDQCGELGGEEEEEEGGGVGGGGGERGGDTCGG